MEKALTFLLVIALGVLVNLFAAWMITCGLNEAHVHVSVGAVLWVVLGVSLVFQTTRGKS